MNEKTRFTEHHFDTASFLNSPAEIISDIESEQCPKQPNENSLPLIKVQIPTSDNINDIKERYNAQKNETNNRQATEEVKRPVGRPRKDKSKCQVPKQESSPVKGRRKYNDLETQSDQGRSSMQMRKRTKVAETNSSRASNQVESTNYESELNKEPLQEQFEHAKSFELRSEQLKESSSLDDEKPKQIESVPQSEQQANEKVEQAALPIQDRPALEDAIKKERKKKEPRLSYTNPLVSKLVNKLYAEQLELLTQNEELKLQDLPKDSKIVRRGDNLGPNTAAWEHAFKVMSEAILVYENEELLKQENIPFSEEHLIIGKGRLEGLSKQEIQDRIDAHQGNRLGEKKAQKPARGEKNKKSEEEEKKE